MLVGKGNAAQNRSRLKEGGIDELKETRLWPEQAGGDKAGEMQQILEQIKERNFRLAKNAHRMRAVEKDSQEHCGLLAEQLSLRKEVIDLEYQYAQYSTKSGRAAKEKAVREADRVQTKGSGASRERTASKLKEKSKDKRRNWSTNHQKQKHKQEKVNEVKENFPRHNFYAEHLLQKAKREQKTAFQSLYFQSQIKLPSKHFARYQPSLNPSDLRYSPHYPAFGAMSVLEPSYF